MKSHPAAPGEEEPSKGRRFRQAKPLVFIPTYNERENVAPLCADLLALGIDMDILFMDDHSPDGTGEIIEGLARSHKNVMARHRAGKLGVGSAHLDGIRWAYEHHYSELITMDCDFTHPPRYVPEILKAARDGGADVVVGSRYLVPRSLAGWNLMRLLLTRTGHFLTHTLLGISQDATGAFRYYRLERIPETAFDLVTSKGYSFFFESLYILIVNGFRITEIPISLPPRTYGHSKMDIAEIGRSVGLLLSLFLASVLHKGRFVLSAGNRPRGVNPKAYDPQNWDEYWHGHNRGGQAMYDAIAVFYRRFIVSRALNSFARKHFTRGAWVLHAGCGSGRVDAEIAGYLSVTGLDLSENALRLFRHVQPRSRMLQGSIFQIPLADESFDGLYNLGVMEHFTESEIGSILKEFHRVLKPHGRMIIFWPPEFGSSVVFLKGVKWFIERVLGKKGVKIHPDEITRLQSKRHAVGIFERAGFSVRAYSFGLKDFFTYSVIVADKPGVAPEAVAEATSAARRGEPALPAMESNGEAMPPESSSEGSGGSARPGSDASPPDGPRGIQ